jgi:predicted Zn-ribbon and HTH transcriptional regulator
MGTSVSESQKEIGMVLLPGCRCRCGHEWLPRDGTQRPLVCPKCKSPRWDKAKLYERKTTRKKTERG